MARALFVVAVFVSLAVFVSGHARLATPAAWNTGYSKTSPCGGVSPPSTTTNIWTPGSARTIDWQIIAGDGVGQVTIKIDRAGQTALTETIPITSGNSAPTTVGTYTLGFTVPADLNCTQSSSTGMCTFQIFSTSAWYSCTSFRTSAATATGGGTTATPTCQTATGLTFCTSVNGLRVGVPVGETPQSLDAIAAKNFAETGNNTNVLATKNAPGCQESFKAYLCGSTFATCAANSNTPPTFVNACRKVCEQMVCFCSLTVSHQNLYDCSIYSNYGRDSYGSCSAGYGPGNSTCVLSSTGAGGPGGDPNAAFSTSYSSYVLMLIAAVLVVAF